MYHFLFINPKRVTSIATSITAMMGGFFVGCAPVQVDNAIPAGQARVAFQSQCAQNVIECTSSWPTAMASIASTPGSTVTETDTGFLVEADAGWGGLEVRFLGSNSEAGAGASSLSFSWSVGATDSDPCLLTPGMEFSTEADPTAVLAPGLHYVRLTVENDIIREEVVSDACGVIGMNIASFDFIEFEVEVRY